MTDAQHLLRHFLAALAYRTQKAIRGAPESFADFQAGAGTRSPRELVRDMASVLGYARTFFIGGAYRAGVAVPSENFLFAEVSASRLGSDQPSPVAPDPLWIGKLVHLAWRLTRWMNRGRSGT